MNVILEEANNSNTPPEVLEDLSRDEDYRVREAVAKNPNTSPEILENLSHDEDQFVREAVAYNSNTPPEVLENLSHDSEVLTDIANNDDLGDDDDFEIGD